LTTFYTHQNQTLLLKLHLQSNAKKDEIAGIYQDRLKIRIAALAHENKANSALIKFFAKLFDVKQACVKIISGEHHRDKTVVIEGIKNLPDFLIKTCS